MITIPSKIPIRIHPLFLVIIFVLGGMSASTITGTLIIVVIIFISVLAHEFGHAITAITFGQTAKIDLVALGGLTTREGIRLPLWQEFLVVLNGPLVGLMLALATFVIEKSLAPTQTGFTEAILAVVLQVNLYWTLLNLLPIQPLDGGHLLQILMEAAFGLRGVKTSLFLSFLFSGVLGFYFFFSNHSLFGAFLLMFTFDNYRSWRSSLLITEQDQDIKLQELLRDAERDFHRGYLESAQSKFQQLREEAQSGMLYLTATHHLAVILYDQRRYQAAFDLLNPLNKQLDAESLKLLQQLSYRLDDLDKAIEVGTRVYQMSPSYDVAFLNALCSAQKGEKRSTIGWLQCALREGLPNWEKLLEGKEFDYIREEPAFQALCKS